MAQRKIVSFFTNIQCSAQPPQEKKMKIEREKELEQNVPTSCSSVSSGQSGNFISSKQDNRAYNKNWERKYPWLYFDKARGGAFCKVCEVFSKNDSTALQRSGGVFITLPFIQYKKALGRQGKLEKHSEASHHMKSVELQRLKESAKANPVHTQILNQSEEEKKCNRESMIILARGVYFLCKNEIAHTTKYEPLVETLLLKISPSLETWVGMQSTRSTYVSRATASELLIATGNVISQQIIEKINNKKFSLMADESTNINNESELSICVRYVNENKPVETFLSLVKLEDTKAESIAAVIDRELQKRNMKYENLVALSFDGAANFSGSISGVRKRLSTKAGREVPYVHCRAHILSLAVTSARNKHPKIKRVFHVLKDIYKLFHQSPKRERILHEIQAALSDSILKIPEVSDVRWLSHYKIVHAVKVSYSSIMVACEHIHLDGADLASLAGGILLEMRNSSFARTLYILDEAMNAVHNLSQQLQNPSFSVSNFPGLIGGSVDHLKEISSHCTGNDTGSPLHTEMASFLMKCSSVSALAADEPEVTTLKNAGKFLDSMIQQMRDRFNDNAVRLIHGSAFFSSLSQFEKITNADIQDLCECISDIQSDDVIADVKSFKYYIRAMPELQRQREENNLLFMLISTSIGYSSLRQIAEVLLCIPISTAGVERSFSAMNRIMNKLRIKLGEETLNHCMISSIEGPENPDSNFFERIVDQYAQKPRRIRLL